MDKTIAVFTSTLFFGAIGLNRSDMLCLLSMVVSMRFNVKMVLSIYIQLTLRDRNSSFACFLPEARDVAMRDSGSGQVQSTKLDRAWVLLHFI